MAVLPSKAPAQGLRDLLTEQEIQNYKRIQLQKYYEQNEENPDIRQSLSLASPQRAFKTRLEFQKKQRAERARDRQEEDEKIQNEQLLASIGTNLNEMSSKANGRPRSHSVHKRDPAAILKNISSEIGKSFALLDQTDTVSRCLTSKINFDEFIRTAREKKKTDTIKVIREIEEDTSSHDLLSEALGETFEKIQGDEKLEKKLMASIRSKALFHQHPELVHIVESIYEDHLQKVELKMNQVNTNGLKLISDFQELIFFLSMDLNHFFKITKQAH